MNNEENLSTLEMCACLYANWAINGDKNDESFHNDLLENSFISKMLLKKFDVFDINIRMPDELLLLLSLCSNENPGLVQVILMDLLQSIKNNLGKKIPKGYKISSLDFAKAFPNEFPIIENESIYKKYIENFDSIKTTYNEVKLKLCDTKEWWMQVIQ